MRQYFSDEAGKVLHNKVGSLLYQTNEQVGHEGLARLLAKLKIKSAQVAIDTNKAGLIRTMYMCFYFGGSCERKNTHIVINELIDMMNDLASKQFIKATLAPLSIMKMAKPVNPFEPQKYIVVSYIHLTPAGEQYAKSTYPKLWFLEGEVPNEFGDIE